MTQQSLFCYAPRALLPPIPLQLLGYLLAYFYSAAVLRAAKEQDAGSRYYRARGSYPLQSISNTKTETLKPILDARLSPNASEVVTDAPLYRRMVLILAGLQRRFSAACAQGTRSAASSCSSLLLARQIDRRLPPFVREVAVKLQVLPQPLHHRYAQIVQRRTSGDEVLRCLLVP